MEPGKSIRLSSPGIDPDSSSTDPDSSGHEKRMINFFAGQTKGFIMNLLVYARSPEGLRERWPKLFQDSIPSYGIEIYRTMGTFVHRLQHPPEHFIIILVLTDRKELLEILSIRHWLEGSRLILIVPDQEEETLKAAHRLRPRFLTYLENDFSQVLRVLNKMAANFETFE
jgi:hypothetical protein